MTDPLLMLRKLTLLKEHAERVRRRLPPTAAAMRDDVDRQNTGPSPGFRS